MGWEKGIAFEMKQHMIEAGEEEGRGGGGGGGGGGARGVAAITRGAHWLWPGEA